MTLPTPNKEGQTHVWRARMGRMVGTCWSWLCKHVGMAILGTVGLVVLIIVVTLLAPVLPEAMRERINRFEESKGVPSFLRFPEVSTEVAVGGAGYGFIALAFENARKTGKTHIECAQDLQKVRICEPTSAVGDTYEKVLLELLARYPKCFSVQQSPGRIEVLPRTGSNALVLDRKKRYWCMCDRRIIEAGAF